MKILYGTGNQAKLNTMRKRLCHYNIEILGADDLPFVINDVDETGNDPLENARIKANAYSHICQKAGMELPVFSCDSGLFFNGFPDDIQPGVHVRNINGKRLSDNEMVDHYSSIARNYGGFITARYKNAICLIMSNGAVYEHMGDDIASVPFYITDKPHNKRVDGFPLDCLSVEIASGKYYYDLWTHDFEDAALDGGFSRFFTRVFNL